MGRTALRPLALIGPRRAHGPSPWPSTTTAPCNRAALRPDAFPPRRPPPRRMHRVRTKAKTLNDDRRYSRAARTGLDARLGCRGSSVGLPCSRRHPSMCPKSMEAEFRRVWSSRDDREKAGAQLVRGSRVQRERARMIAVGLALDESVLELLQDTSRDPAVTSRHGSGSDWRAGARWFRAGP